MEIKLTVTDHELAEDIMVPIQSSISSLENFGKIEWGDIEVERGAVETIFELVGKLELGSVAVGVVSGVLANWLWSYLNKTNNVKVEITTVHETVTKTVKLTGSKKEELENSLKEILKSQDTI